MRYSENSNRIYYLIVLHTCAIMKNSQNSQNEEELNKK